MGLDVGAQGNSIPLGFSSHFLDIVLPVLQPFGMPCIVYVTTGMVQHNSHIWTDQLFHFFHNSKKSKLDLSDLKLGTWRFDNRNYRRITSHKIIDILKKH